MVVLLAGLACCKRSGKSHNVLCMHMKAKGVDESCAHPILHGGSTRNRITRRMDALVLRATSNNMRIIEVSTKC